MTDISLNMIIKPCQSGKTFVMLNQCVNVFKDHGFNNNINVIVCDNSLLQTLQTTKRIDTHKHLDFYKDDNGDLCVVLSSKSTCKTVDALYRVIMRHKIRNVIMCNNAVQMNNISQIIKDFEDHYNFYLWIDEADKFKDFNKKYISRWLQTDNVKNITLITATPEPVLNLYKDEVLMRVLPMNETVDPSVYHRFSESKFNFLNSTLSSVEYASLVIDTYPSIISNGNVIFAPADQKKITHDEMTDLLFEKGVGAVFKINGTEKMLYIKGKDPINLTVLKDTDDKKYITNFEMSDWFARLYDTFELRKTSVAITGNLCIGRGITINSDKVQITDAIIPYIRDKNAEYQTAGRICGNIKHNKIYKPPNVYCNMKTKELVCEMEMKAILIPQKAFQEKNTIITIDDYRHLNKQVDISEYNLNEVLSDNKLQQNIIDKIKKEIENSNPSFSDTFNVKHLQNGFYKTHMRNNYDVIHYTNMCKDKYTGLGKSIKYRINVAYKDLNDPNSGVLFVRILKMETN